ncbi:MAG: ribosome silencing factor [Acidobacteriia bacterium]|jgi:ribosome-associated protein|nr:ribosome silencing factor [Terriglobia bacterium]
MPNSFPPEIGWAIAAAQAKHAADVVLLDLRRLGAFTDYFVLCTGFSTRQVQAIREAITEELVRYGRPLRHVEGGEGAEWVLLDYGDFVVHIFSERARLYYDLERLWRAAPRTEFPDAVLRETEPHDSLR